MKKRNWLLDVLDQDHGASTIKTAPTRNSKFMILNKPRISSNLYLKQLAMIQLTSAMDPYIWSYGFVGRWVYFNLLFRSPRTPKPANIHQARIYRLTTNESFLIKSYVQILKVTKFNSTFTNQRSGQYLFSLHFKKFHFFYLVYILSLF